MRLAAVRDDGRLQHRRVVGLLHRLEHERRVREEPRLIVARVRRRVIEHRQRENELEAAASNDRDARAVRILLVEGGPNLLAMMPPRLRKSALQALKNKGVEVWLDAQIKGYDGRTATLDDGRRIEAGSLTEAGLIS